MSGNSCEVIRELPSLAARLRRGQTDRMPGRLPGVSDGLGRVQAAPRLLPPMDDRPLLDHAEPIGRLTPFDLAPSTLIILAKVSDWLEGGCICQPFSYLSNLQCSLGSQRSLSWTLGPLGALGSTSSRMSYPGEMATPSSC